MPPRIPLVTQFSRPGAGHLAALRQSAGSQIPLVRQTRSSPTFIASILIRPTQRCCNSTTTRTTGPEKSKDTDSVIISQQVPAPCSGLIRVLQLNRPAARNAISRELLQSLSRQVDAIAAENGNGPTRALVLASNVDAAFCAGADLKERRGMTKEEYVFFFFSLFVVVTSSRRPFISPFDWSH